ncbi:MAG: M48 family metallopeptidase [Ignavibacteriales bacterium]|nr:M48 family metallopeptidase [Ignavibacteriales bacterium]MCB9219081.1 M48 family metallopeptidase [Ignavibacteriales bacterium]MCB9259662.1 M48 family metallopeptidase [Ignavibacteriales bacterium]
MDSKKYNNIKLGIGITKTVVTFIIILLFVSLGYSQQLYNILQNYSESQYLILLFYVIVFGFAMSVIFFPVNFYTDFILEHKYKLSNQTFFAWIWEGLKGTLVGGVIGLPILLLFYYVLESYGNLWWLPFAILMFIISVILSKIVPIIILPLFYKVTPIEDEDLKQRIYKLSENVKLKIENIFQFDMSKNTKKANAAFTGLGKTKKILLGDTLLTEFNNDEIETVIAHELGHYKHKHIIINIAISTVTSFLTFYLLSVLYSNSLNWFGFSSITEIAALPILSLWGMILGLVQTPLTNILSRKHEYQADEYAVKSTNKKDVFVSTLTKLTEKNLGDENPHPFVEWFFYSHPSIKNRVAHINNLNIN